MPSEQLKKFSLGRELVGLDRRMKIGERILDLLQERTVDMPSRMKIIVFTNIIKMMPDVQQKYDMRMVGFVFRHMLKERVFCEGTSEYCKRLFELLERRLMRRVGARIPHARNAVVLDLADPFAGNAVFLAYRVERPAFALLAQPIAVYEHLTRTLGQFCEQFLGYGFGREIKHI